MEEKRTTREVVYDESSENCVYILKAKKYVVLLL